MSQFILNYWLSRTRAVAKRLGFDPSESSWLTSVRRTRFIALAAIIIDLLLAAWQSANFQDGIVGKGEYVVLLLRSFIMLFGWGWIVLRLNRRIAFLQSVQETCQNRKIAGLPCPLVREQCE